MGSLACSLVALLLAGSGQGGKYMETVVQDDALFLHRSPASVRASAKRLADLGADRVRLTAGWSAIAPAPRAKRMPAGGFEPTKPSTYPQDGFRKLDTAVKAAKDAGVEPMIDLAFWAPRWAVGRPAPNRARERYFVDPTKFADFAEAVARRYSGKEPDPDEPGKTLPAVRTYTTWNEPNHTSFLMPQWVRTSDGGFRPLSPHLYRAMHNAAYARIKNVSRENQVLLGGTAASGSATPGKGGVRPLEFLRTLACVDAQLKPLQVPECDGFQPIKADGYAHHPYSRLTLPGASDPNPDDAPIGDVTTRLTPLLDQLHKLGRIAAPLKIFETEYGYESSQDDPFQPFNRDQQASFIGWSTFLAWKDPSTAMMAQFLLRDIDPAESGRKKGTRQYYRDWQTGLYAADDTPKPAVEAFKLPFFAQTQGVGDDRSVLLFGQVRPGTGQRTVRVERQDTPGGPWSPIQTFGASCDRQNAEFLTDDGGFFLRSTAFVGPGSYRLVWGRPDGVWEPGQPMAVSDIGAPSPGAVAPTGLRAFAR